MANHPEPPATIKEVGIHIGYLREDMTEVKTLLAKYIEDSATKSEVAKLEKRVEGLEVSAVSRKEVFAIVGAVGLAGTILTITANVMKLFGG